MLAEPSIPIAHAGFKIIKSILLDKNTNSSINFVTKNYLLIYMLTSSNLVSVPASSHSAVINNRLVT